MKRSHRAGGGDEKEECEEGEGQRVGSGGGGEKLEEGDGAQAIRPGSPSGGGISGLHPEHEQRQGNEEVAASEQEVGRGRNEEERDDRRSEP